MIEFKMPSLGADMDEGTLQEWLVKPGDTVTRGQVVAVVGFGDTSGRRRFSRACPGASGRDADEGQDARGDANAFACHGPA